MPEKRPVKYPFSYGVATSAEIVSLLNRVHAFVEAQTPMAIVNRRTGQSITDHGQPVPGADVASGGLRMICYEMGVTCVGMMRAAEVTGDNRFSRYTLDRLRFITELAPYFERLLASDPTLTRDQLAFYPVLQPETLDDAGSLATALIKAQLRGLDGSFRPMIDRLVNHVRTGQHRLSDGTLSRNRPHPNTLWLDDLFMSVPALAHYGLLVGDSACVDDAVCQVLQFSNRMFDRATGLYAHGWVQGLESQPFLPWGRANGWALLAMSELLDVLPGDHPSRSAVLAQLRAHMAGLTRCQSGQGLWHQLLDRADSYLETSASAMCVYGIAHAINQGWIDSIAYGPAAQTGWGAVAARVNAQGQVEGTCVGSGLAFDPVFYYHRPTSVFAAHGYGPVLLAGAEMLRLAQTDETALNDGAIHCSQNRPEVQQPLD